MYPRVILLCTITLTNTWNDLTLALSLEWPYIFALSLSLERNIPTDGRTNGRTDGAERIGADYIATRWFFEIQRSRGTANAMDDRHDVARFDTRDLHGVLARAPCSHWTGRERLLCPRCALREEKLSRDVNLRRGSGTTFESFVHFYVTRKSSRASDKRVESAMYRT